MQSQNKMMKYANEQTIIIRLINIGGIILSICLIKKSAVKFATTEWNYKYRWPRLTTTTSTYIFFYRVHSDSWYRMVVGGEGRELESPKCLSEAAAGKVVAQWTRSGRRSRYGSSLCCIYAAVSFNRRIPVSRPRFYSTRSISTERISLRGTVIRELVQRDSKTQPKRIFVYSRRYV